MKHLWPSALVVLALFFSDSNGSALRGELVTFADFNTVVAVASSTSKVYFATPFGITRYDKIENSWDIPLSGSDKIAQEEIQALEVDLFDQHLYAKTSLDWYEYDLTFERWYPIGKAPNVDNPSQEVRPDGVLYPPDGFTWSGDGYLNDKLGRTVPMGVVLDDGSGVWWIGTHGYGAAKSSSAGRILTLLPYGLIQRRVNALLDDSLLWISGAVSGFRSGITLMDREELTFGYIETGFGAAFDAVDINCFAAEGNTVFAGTSNGVYELSRLTGELLGRTKSTLNVADNDVISLATNGDTLFVGTAVGLSVVMTSAGKSQYASIDEFSRYAIFDMQIVDSSLWVAASNGVYKLSLVTGSLKKFSDPTLVLAHEVFDIDLFGDDLWMSSSSGALRVNVRNGEIEPFRLNMSRTIPRVIEINDTIAVLNSDRGIVLLYYKDDKQITRELTVEDGLPSSYVYSLLFDGDYLWIGTDRGLTRLWWSSPNVLR
jgi:ligand-binding sensor domain-containing protein